MRKKNSPTYYIWMIVWVNRSTNLQKMNSVIRFSVPYSLKLAEYLFSKIPLPLLPNSILFFNTIRSSRPELFCKKGVLKNIAKFTVKHLCQSLFFNKVSWASAPKLKSLTSFIDLFPTNFLFIMICYQQKGKIIFYFSVIQRFIV